MKNKINRRYEEFTGAEKKVAVYVYENEDKVLYMSIGELSKVAEVGEATIVRFCRKLGYNGFQEFKIDLAKNIDKIVSCSDKENFKDVIANNMMEIIELTRKSVDEEKLNQSVELILEANNLYLYGVGSSGGVAQAMEARLIRVGVNARTVIDSHFQAMIAATLNKKDVLIVFSLSGNTKDIICAVEIASEKGAKIISITGDKESMLAKISHEVILTTSRQGPLDGGSLTSQISQLYVIDLICTALSLKDTQKTKRIRQETYDSISSKKL